jgi:hypothetical protein
VGRAPHSRAAASVCLSVICSVRTQTAAVGPVRDFWRGAGFESPLEHVCVAHEGGRTAVYVCFGSEAEARRAMGKDRSYIGKRFFRLALSSMAELEAAQAGGGAAEKSC